MSMDFIGQNGQTLYLNNRGWRRVFRLALMFDWIPTGTLPPIDWPANNLWDPMDYWSNSGQIMSAADTAALAIALERAIPLLRERDPEQDPDKLFGEDWEWEMVQRLEYALYARIKDPAWIFFSINWKEKLQECVTFFQNGACALR